MLGKLGIGLLGLIGCGLAFAVEPPPKTLTADLEALQKERKAALAETGDDAAGSERIRLRTQLLELIRQLGDKQKAERGEPPAKAKEPQAPSRTTFVFPESGAILDTLRMAQNLFKAGETDGALRAFKLLDEKGLAADDRLFVQYMIACCLRKLGKPSDSAVLYREVGESKDDAFLKESALWQLGMLKSTQELESQLEQLRSRRKSR